MAVLQLDCDNLMIIPGMQNADDFTFVNDADAYASLADYEQGHEITGASNTSPIHITSVGHGLTYNTPVTINGVKGNWAANGVFTAVVIDEDHFYLLDSTGDGGYELGGVWYPSIAGAENMTVEYQAGSKGKYEFIIPARIAVEERHKYILIVFFNNYGERKQLIVSFTPST